MAERLYVLDAHSLIYRMFHAIDEMTSPSGVPTNAIFGFVRDIQFLRKDRKPDYLVVAWDASDRTFRNEIAPTYKATRPPMPDDLRVQVGKIREVLEAYRIPVLSDPAVEADDIMASIARAASGRQIDTFLLSADKDLRQVIDERVVMLDLRPQRGRSNQQQNAGPRIIDRQYVADDWGVTPEQVVDYQAMVGDSVDNVPGIRGVGPKTAAQLLQRYGTLDNILQHIDEIPGQKMKENFYKGRQDALVSRELVRLRLDWPLPDDWSAWRPTMPDRARLLALFEELGFHRFADEIRQEFPVEDIWVAEYTAVTTPEQFADLLRELRTQPLLSVDLETTSEHPRWADIVGYALSWQPGQAYYVAVRGPLGETALDGPTVLAALKPILEDPAVAKVGQNLKYDRTVLRCHGVELANIHFDSMLASYLLAPGERSHGLDELSRRHLNHETIKFADLFDPADKKRKIEPQTSAVPVARMAEYAGEDSDVALRLQRVLEPQLTAVPQFPTLFRELEVPLIEVLSEMEYTGIRIDPDRLRGLSGEFAERLAEIRAAAFASVGHEFNLDSPLQLRTLLFDELGLPVLKRTKSGPSTDQEVLEELLGHHPVLGLILEHRRLAKLKGTYLDALPNLIHPDTGRIHASFNQTVTATGRLSSSDPNLQNIPVRSDDGQQIRQAFLPGTVDQVLVSADYSQIELRLLAHFSGDANLKRAFREDQDIHTAVAAQIAGVPAEKVDKNLRRMAKTVNFGIMYGLSAYGLSDRLRITRQEATDFIDQYFANYPTIEAFFGKVLGEAKSQRYVSTILGRRRSITGVRNTTGRNRNLAERTAINTVIQGSAADLIKQAMLNIHRRLQKESFEARLLLQIHDELVFEVSRPHADALAEMVTYEMSHALPLDDVPLKVDVGMGPNWLDVQPWQPEVAR